MPASGCDAMAFTRAASQPGWAAASSFSVARYGAREASKPWFTAAPKPTLRWFSMM